MPATPGAGAVATPSRYTPARTCAGGPPYSASVRPAERTPSAAAPLPERVGETAARARTPSAAVLVAVLLTLVSVIPVVCVVTRMTGRSYFPIQDLAVVDLRVRDVWTLNTPLIGPYSKSFNHPGPMFFWVLAIPSLLAGQAAWATLVASAVVMGLAIVASARVAWRAGGIALVVVALAASTLSLRASFLYMHPWNPNTAEPFFILFLLLVAATAAGDLGKLVWVAVVGSFLLQTHVGYLPVVAAPIALLAGALFRRWRREPVRARVYRREVLKATGVALVLWLPPLAQQIFSKGGNLSAMLKYSGRTQGRAIGVTHALGLLAADFKWRPTWLGGTTSTRFPGVEELPSSAWWLLVPLVLVGAAAFMLWRRPPRRQIERAETWFFAFTVASCLAAIPGLAEVRAPAESYLFRWRAPLTAALVLTALLIIGRRLPRKPLVLGAAAVAVAGLTVSNAVQVSDQIVRGIGPRPGRILPFESLAAHMARTTLRAGLPREPFLMRSAGDPNGGIYEGLVDEFTRRGAPVRVDPWFEFKWGHRVARKQSVVRVVYVTTVGSLADRLASVPSARVLARVTPLSRSEERSIVALQAEAVAAIKEKIHDPGKRRMIRDEIDSPLVPFILGKAGVTIPKHDLDRLTALNRKVQVRSCRCAVIELRVADAPF